MTVFGKRWSEYLRFEQIVLWLILAVGLARLILSLAGLPNSTVTYFSMTVVGLMGVVYCGVRVPLTGFGGYKHLLPLLFLQAVIINGVAIVGVVLARFGMPNILAAAEYGGDLRARYHVLGHVVGMIVGPLLMWLLAALVMWITRKVTGRPAAVRA